MWAHGADRAHGAHGALAQVGYVKGLDHDNGGQGSIARHTDTRNMLVVAH